MYKASKETKLLSGRTNNTAGSDRLITKFFSLQHDKHIGHPLRGEMENKAPVETV